MATVAATGAPHLVPVTFAVLEGDTVVTAVDHKPKRTIALQRLANIAANPAVCLLVDEYSDDWSRLWWVRADGVAQVVESPGEVALKALAARYPQYREQPPQGPMIVISVKRFTGWSWA